MNDGRKIIEKILGRKLSRYEVVHHRDKNHNNNNLDNLAVMSLSDHSSLHMSGRTIPEITKAKLQKRSRVARPGAKLSVQDVYGIRKMLADSIEQWLIGFAFGVNRRTISAINTRVIWSWV